MERKLLNRIKVVLAEKNKSNKWLSEQLDKCRNANSNSKGLKCVCE